MPFVSITRLRVRKLKYLPGFGWYTLRCYFQAQRDRSNSRLVLLMDRRLTFWTVTTWSSERSMRTFRNSGAHLLAMRRLALWCDEATYVNWAQEEDELPSRPTIYERLVTEGIVTRVQSPSVNHQKRSFNRPNWADSTY